MTLINVRYNNQQALHSEFVIYGSWQGGKILQFYSVHLKKKLTTQMFGYFINIRPKITVLMILRAALAVA